ncbi:MAG: VOC family protein [Synechococcaceae cyanobacterium]|nr:VOC family protein [Synechococcaceae cyanobacterium]
MLRPTAFRVARPTNDLAGVIRFYVSDLGLEIIDSFTDHQGFDGVMIGVPGADWHLEFTCCRGHDAGRAPTRDNLLVFYLPDPDLWQVAINRMKSAGHTPVASFNPYWDERGCTFEDPDGYRVVLQNTAWPA